MKGHRNVSSIKKQPLICKIVETHDDQGGKGGIRTITVNE